jgi:DNA-binding transcriptional regulator YdaS (Cro superfamily)
MLISVEEVIDALGGTAAAADLLGMSRPAISTWKARGRIPSDNFMLISDELSKRSLQASPTVFGFRETAQ